MIRQCLAALCLAVLAMVSVVNGLHQAEHQAEQSEDLQRIKSIKENLGALLLDMANENQDKDSFMAIYEECEKLLNELLALDVRNLSFSRSQPGPD
jgi:hypothetical protein